MRYRTLCLLVTVVAATIGQTARAQSLQNAPGPSATIFVDCASTARGNGAAAHPYWRITDALDSARRLRSLSSRPIVIRVAAGTCSGNFETQPTGQKIRPPELLPLVLNVPGLTLHGAGTMDYVDGYPAALHPGTATTVTVDYPRLGILDNTVIYIGPTVDGGRADGTVVEGLEIDVAFNGQYGIWANRAQGLTIRGNVVEHMNFGAVNFTECSANIVGNAIHDGTPGLVVAAGTRGSPSRFRVAGNSVTANYEGVALFGDSMATEHLDMGANPLEPLPYPINPMASQMGNQLYVELTGNDVSYNYIGLRFAVLGGSRYPYSTTGNISANVHDNQFMDNAGYPFALDQGFAFRSTSAYWTSPDPQDFPEGWLGFLAVPFITHGPIDGPYSGSVNATFAGNVWSNENVTPIAPAFLTTSYIDVYDPTTGAPDPALMLHYTYLRNTQLTFVDGDGLFSQAGVIRDDLRRYDPVDGTALRNQTRIRRLQ